MTNPLLVGTAQVMSTVQLARQRWPEGNVNAVSTYQGRPGININGSYICGAAHPQAPEWVCSLADKHPTDHKAYINHTTNSRGMYVMEWPSLGRRKVTSDDVAEAIASIQSAIKPKVNLTPPLTPAAVQAHVWTEDDDYYLVGANVWERCEEEDHDHGILTREELVQMLNQERHDHARTIDQLVNERQTNSHHRVVLGEIKDALDEHFKENT